MSKIKVIMMALLLAVSGAVNAQSTKDQIRALLEDFCVTYYNNAFGPRQYIEGTLSVTSLEADEVNDVIKVRGKHSYRGQSIPFFGRSTHSNVDYKAEVSVKRTGIKIKFWKWYEPDMTDPNGHWEGPCEKTIIP